MTSKIAIGFSSSDTIFGRIVRYLTNSSINHVFLIYESSEWGGEWVAQVDQYGVRKIPLKRLLNDTTYVERYECLMSLGTGMKAMRDYIGARYDWKGVLWGLFCLLIWKLFHEKIFHPRHSLSRMFCSEFVAGIIKKSNVPETACWEPSAISPNDLRLFIQSSNIFKLLGA